MSCNGICQDAAARIHTAVVCPRALISLPHKLRVELNNANLQYNDICKETVQNANVTYINAFMWFKFDKETNSMVKFPNFQWAKDNGHEDFFKPITGKRSAISHHYEILTSFFENNQIIPTWIQSSSGGIYNKSSGSWTGAVGKVYK